MLPPIWTWILRIPNDSTGSAPFRIPVAEASADAPTQHLAYGSALTSGGCRTVRRVCGRARLPPACRGRDRQALGARTNGARSPYSANLSTRTMFTIDETTRLCYGGLFYGRQNRQHGKPNPERSPKPPPNDPVRLSSNFQPPASSL
jgi:hypothetical protein